MMNERDKLQLMKEMCVREIYRLAKSVGEEAKLNFSNPELEAARIQRCADRSNWCMAKIREIDEKIVNLINPNQTVRF